MEPPFFVIGAPRSGTTYIVEVLQRHPDIFLTNETRVMTYVNRCLNVWGQAQWVLLHHRADWLDTLHRELPRVVWSFYRDLGARPGMRWGDKNPHYADPSTDPDCLDTIASLFPTSQFLHLIRDGRNVVASLTAKGWVSFDDAVDTWHRHVAHARSFGQRVGPHRYLEIHYEQLVSAPDAAVGKALDFLDVGAHPEVTRFLADQRKAPTPFSGPTSGTPGQDGETASARLPRDQRKKMHKTSGRLLRELGYELEEPAEL